MAKNTNSYQRLRIISRFVFEAALCFSFLAIAGIILSCGNSVKTESKSKENSPPVIDSINLLPKNPTIGSDLNSFVQSHDPDGDPVICQYEWLRNDGEIIGTDKTLSRNKSIKKGDLVRIRVTPSDGKVKGTVFLSAPVKILNSFPVSQEVWVEPKVAYATDRLKASATGFDRDGDSIYYSYEWAKNGVILSEEREEYLKSGKFEKGDSITVTVTPDDGETHGSPKKSEPVTIGNSPPLIISSPPSKTDRDIYTYQVKANDPDNDPITFSLKTPPRNMGIDKETGLIRWKIHKGDQGTQPIEIEASDSEGAKSIQRYTLSISVR
jgi:hypothetical protein